MVWCRDCLAGAPRTTVPVWVALIESDECEVLQQSLKYDDKGILFFHFGGAGAFFLQRESQRPAFQWRKGAIGEETNMRHGKRIRLLIPMEAFQLDTRLTTCYVTWIVEGQENKACIDLLIPLGESYMLGAWEIWKTEDYFFVRLHRGIPKFRDFLFSLKQNRDITKFWHAHFLWFIVQGCCPNLQLDEDCSWYSQYWHARVGKPRFVFKKRMDEWGWSGIWIPSLTFVINCTFAGLMLPVSFAIGRYWGQIESYGSNDPAALQNAKNNWTVAFPTQKAAERQPFAELIPQYRPIKLWFGEWI